jgi:uncharacterized membrane protein YciS (DUF1049 family)
MVLLNQAVLPVVGVTLYLVGERPYRLATLMATAIGITLLGTWLIRYQMRTHASVHTFD